MSDLYIGRSQIKLGCHCHSVTINCIVINVVLLIQRQLDMLQNLTGLKLEVWKMGLILEMSLLPKHSYLQLYSWSNHGVFLYIGPFHNVKRKPTDTLSLLFPRKWHISIFFLTCNYLKNMPNCKAYLSYKSFTNKQNILADFTLIKHHIPGVYSSRSSGLLPTLSLVQ